MKNSTITILQYINYKNNKPIGRTKYALSQFRQQVTFILSKIPSMTLLLFLIRLLLTEAYYLT